MTDWIDIEKELPKWMSRDIGQGYTGVEVLDDHGETWIDGVTDHQTWYYLMKELGVTHWRYVSGGNSN
jgi:hypothetical protein